jgi:hypothetical protein
MRPWWPRWRRCASRTSSGGADVGVKLAELKKADSWSRGEFIEKGGWATFSDSKSPERVSSVARACAELLTV